MSDQKKLFLLDAYALIYRAYYAFIKNPRINSKGQNTSAVLGFINTLDEVLKKEKPTHIAVVFDPPGGSFRRQLDPKYKAQRPPTPEEIILSVPYIKQVLEGFRIPAIEVPNYEADDTIGTLAKMAEKEGFTVYMMTPDKDFGQLVSENIFMYKPKRGRNDLEILGAEEIKAKYKIKDPIQVIDILAIWGDTSDNIQGIKGIGEKTAIKLISQFGSAENLLANTASLKGKQKENVENSNEIVALSKKLVTIALDVPVEFDETELKVKKLDETKLKALFEELEFNALSKRILPNMHKSGDQPIQGNLFGMQETVENTVEEKETPVFDSIQTVEHDYQLLETPEAYRDLAASLANLNEFCFDTETTGLDAHQAELVGIAFSWEKNKAFYVSIPDNQKEAKEIVDIFKVVLENKNIRKVGQNIKYDLLILKNYDIKLAGELFDTMIAHYLLFPEQRHNLDRLTQTYLNYQMVSIEELIGKKGKMQLNMRQVAPKKVNEYAGEDADKTYQIKHILEEKLQKANLMDLAQQIEMPLVYVLAQMESNGVRLDSKHLADYAIVLSENIAKAEAEIFRLSGSEFNVGSPKQLGEILFDKMKIINNPVKTKTKQYSTSEQELSKLKDKHEIVEQILEYRSLKKLLSTYVDSLPKLVNPKTKKLHTSYNQAVAATGRLSSNNPNLQNIPIRTKEGQEIRKAFVPSDEEHVIFAADYSQIELRLMAAMSKDTNMLEAFRNGEDIHAATAAKINSLPLNEVSREMRSKAKSANFGIIYGISSFGLAQNLKISRKEAKELINGYFNSYPEVKIFMDEQIRFAREHEFVQTIMHRKRFLKDINSHNGIVRTAAERNAINAPIQGSAADVIKIAMIRIHQKMKEMGLKSKMILQVHDELVFDAIKTELELLQKMVIEEMENAVKVNVPMTVDTGLGNNWLEAH